MYCSALHNNQTSGTLFGLCTHSTTTTRARSRGRVLLGPWMRVRQGFQSSACADHDAARSMPSLGVGEEEIDWFYIKDVSAVELLRYLDYATDLVVDAPVIKINKLTMKKWSLGNTALSIWGWMLKAWLVAHFNMQHPITPRSSAVSRNGANRADYRVRAVAEKNICIFNPVK
jgi:hypothetical protein